MAGPWSDFGPDRSSQAAYLDNQIELWRRLGYDFVRFESGLGFPETLVGADDATAASGRRGWADEHQGMIRTRDDFERYPWPRVEDFDFFPYEYLAAKLPEGMGLIACHAGGVFEHLSWIMSLEGLAFALVDDQALVRAVADRIGGLMLRVYEHLVELPRLVAVFPGDDMGFKHRDPRLPRRPARARPALACPLRRPGPRHGQAVLPPLLRQPGRDPARPDRRACGIDGKHSFEDAILPAEEFQARWGDRAATLGGVDVNILCRRHGRASPASNARP